MEVLHVKGDFRNKDMGTEVKNLMAISLQQGIGPVDQKSQPALKDFDCMIYFYVCIYVLSTTP